MYRNPKLLKLAQECAECQWCMNYAYCVAAHSNQLKDGKGRALKANDYRIAFLCNDCHMMIDQGKMDRAQKIEMWEEAHRKTIGWLFENGHLEVK